jgi:hypothetical protein
MMKPHNLYQAIRRAIANHLKNDSTYYVTWEGDELGFQTTQRSEPHDLTVYNTEEGRYPLGIGDLMFTKQLDQLNEMMGKDPKDVYSVVCWLQDICLCKQQVSLELNESIDSPGWTEFKEKAEQWKVIAHYLSECAEKLRALSDVPSIGDIVTPKMKCPQIENGIVKSVWIGDANTDGRHFAGKILASVQWFAFPHSEHTWQAEDLIIVNPVKK